MEMVASVTKQMHTQMLQSDTTTKEATQTAQTAQKAQESTNGEQSANKAIEDRNKELLNSEKDVHKLVEDLNEEISALNTTLRFGVDKSDTFYVSIIDKKTDKVIRRWPAEEAKSLLPKMREFTGMLFDTRG